MEIIKLKNGEKIIVNEKDFSNKQLINITETIECYCGYEFANFIYTYFNNLKERFKGDLEEIEAYMDDITESIDYKDFESLIANVNSLDEEIAFLFKIYDFLQ